MTKRFGPTVAVDDLTLDVPEGVFFTLLGPSGCGKTTILRMIAGFEAPSAGRVVIGGRDVTALGPERRRVGMVFQNYALFPHLSVEENVAYGLRVGGIGRGDRRARTAEYMELVQLGPLGARRIGELSGGQQQRVALARAMAVEPRILLLDEPLSNLDARLREEMRDEILRVHRHLGATSIYVTHDQSEALAMSDRVAIFHQGQCRQIGTPHEVYHAPSDPFVATFVGDSNIFEARTEDGALVLQGTLRVPGAGAHGGRVLIRPEAIGVRRAAGPGTMRGRVVKAQFTGPLSLLEVDVEGVAMKVLHVSAPDGSGRIVAGDRVHLAVDPAGIRPLWSRE